MTGLRDVCFSYGKQKILHNLSFTVEPGQCTVLAGPNGSGKSTALSLLAGVFRPDSGEVLTDGPVGFVPQGIALFEDMTVGDNLRFFAGAAGSPLPETLPFDVGQLWGKKVSALSGGMKKRVSIACALLGSPRVVLFDEPCASLDVEYKEDLIALICDLKARGCTVIYVTHDPAEVAPFYDQLVFFGSTPAVYSREQLSGNPADDKVFRSSFSELFHKKREENRHER